MQNENNTTPVQDKASSIELPIDYQMQIQAQLNKQQSPVELALQHAKIAPYVHPLMEEIKALGNMSQACTLIRILRFQNEKDDSIIQQLNDMFVFTGLKIKKTDWKKILSAYPDIRRAYMSAQLNSLDASLAFANDYLTDYFTSHTNDAKNAIAWQKNILDAKTKQAEIEASKQISKDATAVSESTRSTLAMIAESLTGVEQPDFDAPAEEDINYDNTAGDE